jgi:cell division protein FtsI (penicillin-binding protein 3)
MAEDDAPEHTGDIGALYAAANDLPNDDPLRAAPTQPAPANQPSTAAQARTGSLTPNAVANAKGGKADARVATVPSVPGKAPGAATETAAKQPQTTAMVTIATGKTLRVPSLIGLPVRKVIEQASAAGLEVQVTGNGTVREQAPAAGTMVAPGTQIVVRCGR